MPLAKVILRSPDVRRRTKILVGGSRAYAVGRDAQLTADERRAFLTLLRRRAALAFLGLSPVLEVLAGHENRSIQRITLRRG